MKFGGAALRDAAAMRHVAAIVASESPRETLVVASAMEGVTDQILHALPDVMRNSGAVDDLIAGLTERHLGALEQLRSPSGRQEAERALEIKLANLERVLLGIHYTQETTPRLHDAALSYGERLSAVVLAAYLRDRGSPARSFDADQVGIITNGRFGWASPDLERTREKLNQTLRPVLGTTIPVVTGFFGVSSNGHATLFGRGGSDFTAAVLANALDAECLEVWKDTRGFMTADPKLVPSARPVTCMGYDEAAELANLGAKILHPRTVEPLAPRGIPVRIRDLRDPAAEGTTLVQSSKAPPCFIRSVAVRRNVDLVRLLGPGMGYTPGIGHEVFRVLAERQVNVINMAASEASFALLVDGAEGGTAIDALGALKGGLVQDVLHEPGMALVAVVGKELGKRVGSASQILGAVARASVNVSMISLGASDIAIDFLVKEGDAARAAKAVHEAFVETAGPGHVPMMTSAPA